jgi:hypothetical protein
MSCQLSYHFGKSIVEETDNTGMKWDRHSTVARWGELDYHNINDDKPRDKWPVTWIPNHKRPAHVTHRLRVVRTIYESDLTRINTDSTWSLWRPTDRQSTDKAPVIMGIQWLWAGHCFDSRQRRNLSCLPPHSVRHYATSRKITGLSPDEAIFFNLPNPSSRCMALGSTHPLTETSTRNLPEGKGRPARKADNPSVYKMWEPRFLTALWATSVCYWDSFTFTLPPRSELFISPLGHQPMDTEVKAAGAWIWASSIWIKSSTNEGALQTLLATPDYNSWTPQ